jgi:trk system potassium uptake protein TrkA
MGKSYAVLGLGAFGYQMAISLQEGGGEVLAVDLDEQVIQRISPFVTKAAVADISDEEALRSLGIFEVDTVIIGMPDHFDCTVLVTHFLKQSGIPEILAQVESEAESCAILAVGATRAIFPERDIARRVSEQLLVPDKANQIPLGEDVSLIEMPCPREWAGKSLLELNVRKRLGVYIIGIKELTGNERKPLKFNIFPSPDRPLAPNDILMVLGKSDRLVEIRKKYANGE